MQDATTAPIATLDGPRATRPEERDALLEMVNFIFRIPQGRASTIGRDWAHVYAPENLANVMVIRDPQRIAAEQPESAAVTGQLVASTGVWVSDVAIGAHTLRIGGINCVGTLPEYRRHGLGAQVMTAAHQTMRDRGCHIGLLSTGITNWYRRLGWENAGVIRTYTLNRGNIGLLPELRPGVHVRVVQLDTVQNGAMDPSVADAVMQLYTAAHLGAMRNATTFQQLITARQVEQIVLAEEAGRAVAYLLLSEQTVMEWAGATADVLGLVRATFTRLDDPTLSTSQRGAGGRAPSLRRLSLETPAPMLFASGAADQLPLPTWLDHRGFPFHSDYLGMLYVVDPQGVLDAFGVTGVEVTGVEVAAQQSDNGVERFVVRMGDSTRTFDRGQLVKLFFGPERVLAGEETPFPLPCWQWSLEMV